MQIIWKITETDIAKAKEFIEKHYGNNFVQSRIRMNVQGKREPISIDNFWKSHIACLATTQQRSGPGSMVNKFVKSTSFILDYASCRKKAEALEQAAQKELANYRLRRSNRIAKELSENIHFISENWPAINEYLVRIEKEQAPLFEREAAEYIQCYFKGFGPKQSRNLLQTLRISRYEIPIDSRITKWLNNFGFPFHLTAQGLGDKGFYNFVSDGIQALAEACDILPCVLDAVIFSSYDKGEWTVENIF